jgi:hypothetical protein
MACNRSVKVEPSGNSVGVPLAMTFTATTVQEVAFAPD